MPLASDVVKRVFLGRALRSDRASEQELSKRLALPIFASDPLSSVAYATQEILVVLSLAGLAYYSFTPYAAAAVVLLLTVVVISNRQLVKAYPTGGGNYEVTLRNLGGKAGTVVASALLIDYVLTVAVSVSAGVDNIISAFPVLEAHRVMIALGFVVFLTAMNLRGVKESGRLFAIPTYAFVVGVLAMVVVGVVKHVTTAGGLVAESAGLELNAEAGYGALGAIGITFLALRAFSSGCTALTGVEAIANGVPAFRTPKAKNAATTLAVMGGLAATMFAGLTTLAVLSDVRYAEDPVHQFVGFPEDGVQRTVISQVAAAVFGDGSIGFYLLAGATAGVLILAANTAYNAFPSLSSLLAQYRYMPRQLHTRGDRLVYSNGILSLAVAAGLLIVAFDASVTRLIQLYILGVFTSFTFGQIGMVVHWNRALPTATPEQARTMKRSRAINAFGASLTAIVLVLVTTTKFAQGAYLVLIAMPIIYVIMSSIKKHYDRVSLELEADDEPVPLPSRNHAIVLVSKLHAPTLRALAYAQGTRPHALTALTVNVDAQETAALQAAWEARNLQVSLTTIDSPFRDITRPVLDYVRSIRLQSPRDVVTVFIPEYVVGHWWEQLLHNQSALRLKARLLFQPGVMVTSVAYQLKSSDRLRNDDLGSAPGDVRRPGQDA